MAPPSNGRPSVFGREYESENPVCLVMHKRACGKYRVINGEEKETFLTATPCANNQLVLRDANKRELAMLYQIVPGDDLWDWEVSTMLHSKKIFSVSGNHTEAKVSLDGVGFQIKRLANTCIIYYEKDSSTDDIADILPLENGGNFLVGVRPNVDQVFVATLSVILDFMKFITEPEGSPPVMGQPVSLSNVIGPEYISEVGTELVFKKAGESAAGEYTVVLDQKVFTLKSVDNLQVILDEKLKLIAQLSKKTFTLHSRWEVSSFGESEAGKIVSSVCRHHIIQKDINLDVTLEKETEKKSHAAVIKVTGSWEKKDFTIFKENPLEIIAIMTPLKNDKFKVKVLHAGVDCAFLVSLIAVLLAMKTKSSRKKKGVKLFLKFVGEATGAAVQFLLGELV